MQHAYMTDLAPLKELRKRIAGEVRAEMARQGKTQLELAEAIGITQPTVSYKLRATSAIHAEELVMIANWLGVPAAQFLVEPALVSA
jgi:transcriptional regulator with XRE-family HTH domain